jgi:hypothetical protein
VILLPALFRRSVDGGLKKEKLHQERSEGRKESKKYEDKRTRRGFEREEGERQERREGKNLTKQEVG